MTYKITLTCGLVFALFLGTLFCQSNTRLSVGMKAPNFILKDYSGKSYRLSSYFGKSVVVIYFYPKAGTSGCTKQACGIRDDIKLFKEKNITVLGISIDSKKELRKFVQENNLNFPLLSDQNKTVTTKFGVLRDDGKAKRVTFIVDKKGMIANILEVTDVSSHSSEVFQIASQL